MMTLKYFTAGLLLLAGVQINALAEGPAPLPFDSPGFSEAAQKPANSTPAANTPSKEEPKKAAREEDTSTTEIVKQCQKIAGKKSKGKKAPAKTVCKNVEVKKKSAHANSESSASEKDHEKPACKKGRRCAPAKQAKNEVTEEKPACKKGKKCKAASNDEPAVKKKGAKKPAKKR